MPQVLPHQKEKYWRLRTEGYSQRNAAALAGFSYSSALRLEKATPAEKKAEMDHAQRLERLPGPIPFAELKAEAQRALWDFPYFQQRYFGRIPAPWQEEAANKVVALLETEEEEYVVTNAPPGSGKTICFCHDIPAWITVRDRTIRGLIGSATMQLAKRNVMRLRRSFERTLPERGIPRDVARGDALDAVATLAEDFGRFRPITNDPWTNEAFLVSQFEEMGAVSEKEPTWSAYGIDTSFIGGRYPFIIWDDLVDPRKSWTSESRIMLEEIWDDVCETRLEPGGLLMLQGQRLYADDLYRYNLDKVQPIDDDEDEEDDDREMGKKYHHIIFKAHYEDRCDGTQHARTSKPYPEGCLLVPRRIRWKKVRELQENKGQSFNVIYQQEDTDPSEVLVDKDWVWGHNGHPGCFDKFRDRLEIPEILRDNPLAVSVATADPSPTMFWSVQWWGYDPETKQRFLLDLLRRKMDAPEFLDYSHNEKRYIGCMDDWQRASETLGFPIQAWVVEHNAAQRFLMQYEHVRIWRGLHDVDIIPHTTGRNKADPEYGVETLGPHWEYGRVRLPGKGEGKLRAMHLVDEVTRYPHGRYDDCVMAEWFFEWNLPQLEIPDRQPIQQWRPSWMKQTNGSPLFQRAG